MIITTKALLLAMWKLNIDWDTSLQKQCQDQTEPSFSSEKVKKVEESVCIRGEKKVSSANLRSNYDKQTKKHSLSTYSGQANFETELFLSQILRESPRQLF